MSLIWYWSGLSCWRPNREEQFITSRLSSSPKPKGECIAVFYSMKMSILMFAFVIIVIKLIPAKMSTEKSFWLYLLSDITKTTDKLYPNKVDAHSPALRSLPADCVGTDRSYIHGKNYNSKILMIYYWHYNRFECHTVLRPKLFNWRWYRLMKNHKGWHDWLLNRYKTRPK